MSALADASWQAVVEAFASDAENPARPFIIEKTEDKVVFGLTRTSSTSAVTAPEDAMAGPPSIPRPHPTQDSTSNRGKIPPTSPSKPGTE